MKEEIGSKQLRAETSKDLQKMKSHTLVELQQKENTCTFHILHMCRVTYKPIQIALDL